ncbi:MAG: siderophore-interacting protein [Ilumatobacter sp.]|uniref:siderophore-interacting protein n=1 Tax=Ilumatobacter sp. TaxID=1967498 RepID=UPI003C77D0F7
MNNDDAAAKIASIRREPPSYRRLAVRSVEPVTEHMLRIVLGGDELDGFSIEAPASSVRLLLPDADTDELVMVTWTGNQFELPDGSRPPIRTFTPRDVDVDRNELTIEVVLHEHGAASDWARRARPGDEVAVSGPGRSDDLDPDARSHLLVGDESAMPAIAQLLEWIPEDRTIDAHIEIHTPDARLALPDHPNATVTWHDAVEGGSPGDAMAAAVMGVTELADAVWIAGEAAAVQRIRKYLFDERGRDRSGVTARGYWKKGRSAT